MEFIIVIVFWIIMLIILGYLFKTSNKKILEIGTAVGYSAICFTEFLDNWLLFTPSLLLP